MPQLSLHTPIGPITVSAEEDAIVALDWGWGRDLGATPLRLRARGSRRNNRFVPSRFRRWRRRIGRSDHSDGCPKAWLQSYFDREITRMTLPLAPFATPYRQRVWAVIGAIPVGSAGGYGAVAQAAGSSPRSVCGAMAANPLPLLMPCHRVLGCAPGRRATIGGGEGNKTRRFILALEHRAAASRALALVQQSGNSHPVCGSGERISGLRAALELCESGVLLEFDVCHAPGSPRQEPRLLRSLAGDYGRWIEVVLAVGAWARKRGADLKFSTLGRAGHSQNIGNGVTR